MGPSSSSPGPGSVPGSVGEDADGDRRWVADLPRLAREVLPVAVWTFLEAGAREEVTLAEAESAWSAYRLAPHVLRDVTTVDAATTLLGEPYQTPLGVAPTSMQRAAHPEGELATAAGAAAAGALHVVSSHAGHSVADIGRHGPWWLQVYLPPERETVLPLLERAVGAGARALVLTADTPVVGTKYAVDDGDWVGVDLGWLDTNRPLGASTPWAADLTTADIGWLRETTGLPVVVKGVLRPDDARRCAAAGAAAVWVSNHGGRQLDRSLSTAQALPSVVSAVGGEAEVYVDGGVRSGLDALVALALGARAVLVGRPVFRALAVDGASGVARLFAELHGQLVEAMRLGGATDLAGLRALVVQRP